MIRKPAFQLLLFAAASAAIYWFALVRPYGLLDLWSRPNETVAKLTDYDPRAGVGYVLAFLALFLLYVLACRLVLRIHTRPLWLVVIAGAVAFNAILLWLYPLDSSDIFDTILRGRMQAYHGANPYYQRPSSDDAFKRDPFYGYAGWHDYPMAYGPWWAGMTSALARLPGDGIVENVVAFKLLSIAAYAGTAILIGLLLAQHKPERPLYGVVLFAWNPLVLYTVAGNGHNDAVMVLTIALGFFWLAGRHYTLAAMAFTGGALVKFIPALFFPIVLVVAWKELEEWPNKVRYFALTGLVCGAMVALSYAPFWRGPDVFGEDWRSVMYTTSLPTLARFMVSPFFGGPLAATVVSRSAAFLLGVWVLGQLFGLWRDRKTSQWESQVHAGLSILLFYLLVTCLWFEPWYAIWPLALVALLPDGIGSRGSILLSLAVMFKMPIFDFVMLIRPDHIPPEIEREWQITPSTLGVPWLYFAYQFLKQKAKGSEQQAVGSKQ